MKKLIWIILGSYLLLPASVRGGDARPAPRAGVRAQDFRPLGAWFAGYEKLTFDNEMAWPADAYVVSYYSSKIYTPFRSDNLGRHSVVLFGHHGGRPLEVAEKTALERWVRDGGSLLLSGVEGLRMFGPAPPGWLGITGWQIGDKTISCSLLKPDHPLAKKLPLLKPETLLPTTSAALAGPRAVSVIGRDKASTLLVAQHGKGKIIYLGGNLMPQGRPAWKEKQIVSNVTPLAAQVWANLLDFLPVPRRSTVIRHWHERRVAKFPDITPPSLWVWWRHQKETPLGARSYMPPHPLPDDELASLPLNMGTGERYRRSLFVTAVQDQSVTIQAADFHGESGQIAGSSLQVFLQKEPAADYPKASYWLVPLAGPVTLKANESYTFWLIMNTAGAKPGTYEGAVEFRRQDKRLAHRLPVVLKVWDVRYPGPELLHYELEHCWFTMPGGYWIEKDRRRKVAIGMNGKPFVETPLNDPEVLGNYIKALGELEVDFAQSWSDVARLYPLSFVRLRENGKPLDLEIEQRPAQFRERPLPRLDFSEVFDAYFDRAVAEGMRYYAMNYHLAGDGTLALARRIAGDPKLPPEAELHRRVRTWYWGEYARYIRERGLLGVYTKILDEFSPKEVPAFIASARAIRPAGFKTYTTTYNFDRHPQAVKEIAPHMDLWQLGWDLNPRQRFAGLSLKNPPEIWGTTASSFWGNFLDYGRGAGWAAARLRYQGVHTHGYQRWFWNDHEGCFPGPRGPLNTVTVTNYAQGIADGRYLALLYRLLERARSRENTAALADEIQKDLGKIIGTENGCLVRLCNQPEIPGGGFAEYWWPEVCLSPAVYEAARLKVFELIVRLKKQLGPIPASLKYGDWPLIEDGRARAILLGDSAVAGNVADAVEKLAGTAIPRKATLQKGRPALVVGTLQDPVLRDLAAGQLKGQITPHYPRPGHYLIRLLPESSAHAGLLLVVGGDAVGTRKGVQNLFRLWVLEDW